MNKNSNFQGKERKVSKSLEQMSTLHIGKDNSELASSVRANLNVSLFGHFCNMSLFKKIHGQ